MKNKILKIESFDLTEKNKPPDCMLLDLIVLKSDLKK